MIVLHEVYAKPGSLVEIFLIEAFKEESPAVTKDSRFDYQHVRNGGGNYLHMTARSLNSRNKYWP